MTDRIPMERLTALLNLCVLSILIFIGIDTEFWRTGTGGFIFSLFILPFLINLYVLLKHIPSDGPKKGLMITLSLFGSVVVFIGIIVGWVVDERVSSLEFIVTFSMFITSLMTLIVLNRYRLQWVKGFPKLTSLYFKRRRLEEELRVRELEEKLNKKNEEDL